MDAAIPPRISVIIPVRNRGGVRLENCLRSLAWQEMAEGSAEIILSDFGSEPTWAEELERLAADHGARIVRTDTDEIWNRSRALNVGIRSARGHYVLCTDADMIFAPDFLAMLLNAQQQHKDQALAVCRCRDLPESVPEQPWTRDDVSGLVTQSTYRERLGTGARDTWTE